MILYIFTGYQIILFLHHKTFLLFNKINFSRYDPDVS